MVYLLIAWWISMAEFVRTWPWQPGWIRPLWPACSWDRRGWWVVDKKRVAWCFQWCFQWVKYGDWTMNYGCFLGFKHEFHGWTIKMEIRSMNMVLLQCIYCIYIYIMCVWEYWHMIWDIWPTWTNHTISRRVWKWWENHSWQWCISIGKCMIHHYGHIGLLDYWMFCFFFHTYWTIRLGEWTSSHLPAACGEFKAMMILAYPSGDWRGWWITTTWWREKQDKAKPLLEAWWSSLVESNPHPTDGWKTGEVTHWLLGG